MGVVDSAGLFDGFLKLVVGLEVHTAEQSVMGASNFRPGREILADA